MSRVDVTLKGASNARPALITVPGRAGVGVPSVTTGGITVPTSQIFTPDSYWNTPLPANAPIRSDSATAITALGNDTGKAGVNWLQVSLGNFGMPVYYTKPTDPIFHVITSNANVPDEFKPGGPGIKMPAGRAGNAEGAMTIIDRTSWSNGGQAGGLWVAAMHMAGAANWTGTTYQCDGGAIYYINSNGLDKAIAGISAYNGNTQPTLPMLNHGTLRGCPNNVRAGFVKEDYLAGSIDHAIELFINNTGNTFVYPWVGTENGSFNQFPEGTRIRIKQNVDISVVGPVGSAARILATCLQKYGGICGDQAGSGHQVKAEVTSLRNGGPSDWQNTNLTTDCLKLLPFTPTFWEVIAPGYEP